MVLNFIQRTGFKSEIKTNKTYLTDFMHRGKPIAVYIKSQSYAILYYRYILLLLKQYMAESSIKYEKILF